MKKYVAFCGGQNSGVITKEKATEWAATRFVQHNIEKVFIAEVIEVVEQTQPAVRVFPYLPRAETPRWIRRFNE